MIGRNNRFVRVTGVGLALVMTLALSAGPLLADCENQDGAPRDCTVSENFRQCLGNARDAFDQCRDNAGSFWGRWGCEIGYETDQISCGSALIKDIMI